MTEATCRILALAMLLAAAPLSAADRLHAVFVSPGAERLSGAPENLIFADDFEVGDADGWSNGPGGPPAYDLYATDDQGRGPIPFPVRWPIRPTITSQATVTTAADLLASLAVHGRQTTVQSGTTITLPWDPQHLFQTIETPTDVHLIVEPGAVIDYTGPNYGLFWHAPTRVWLSGGGQLNVSLASDDATDFLIEDLIIRSPYQDNQYRPHRMAIVGCDIESYQYGLYLLGDPQHQIRDVIVANSSIVSGAGGQSTFRVADTSRRLVFVDNRFRNTHDPVAWAFRVHHDAQYFWLRGNQFEEGGVWFVAEFTGSEWPGFEAHVWFYDNQLYESVGMSSFMTFSLNSDLVSDGYPRIQHLTVEGNQQYTSAGAFFGQENTDRPGWVFDDNTFGAQQDPPPWSRR